MSDGSYFRQRAIVQRQAALRATHMASFRAHMDMVREYERRAFSLAA